MCRPEFLSASAERNAGEGLETVGGGEGDVVMRVPVLGEDDMLEASILLEAVDEREDLVAALYGKRTTLAEVVLHVNDD